MKLISNFIYLSKKGGREVNKFTEVKEKGVQKELIRVKKIMENLEELLDYKTSHMPKKEMYDVKENYGKEKYMEKRGTGRLRGDG